jgi:hypothetical protein
MHLGARYYMRETGMFLQRDPISRRLYVYAYGYMNPGNVADPSGKFAHIGGLALAGCGAGAIVGSISSAVRGGGVGRAVCMGFASCAVGAATGALTAAFPGAAAGCLSGVISTAGNTGANALCDRLTGHRTCVNWKCEAWGLLINVAFGCAAGYFAGSKSEFEHWFVGIVSDLIGIDVGSFCTESN